MASRGQVQVEVVADTSKFPAQVERELRAALRGIRLSAIPVDADTAPFIRRLREAQEEADKSFRGLFDKIRSQAGKAGAGIGAALGVGLQAALASGVAPAVSSIIALLASIGPAVLAAIPAAVGVLGTMKVALFGVGDALKEVGADQEKFDEAIKKLSPNAQRFAKALRSLLPQLTQVKNAVQDRFFSGFDKDLVKVSKNLLGPVKQGMTGVAGELNSLIRRTGEYAASSKGADAVTGIFRATRQVLAEVDKILGPVIDKFLDLVIAGTDAKKIDGAFSTAKETLKSLAEAAGNVKDAVGSIFSGLGKDGPSVAAGLAEATGAVKEFLASAQAQELLATLGNVMDRIREIALRILEVLPSLTPAVNGLATGAFGVLLGVVEKLVDALAPLAEDLGGQEELFKNVGAAIAIAVIAVKAYQAALVVATVAQVAWKIATIAASAATTVATAAYNTARVAVLLLQTGWYTAGAAATTMATAIWGQVTALAATAAGWARNAALALANTVRLVAYTVAVNAVRVATIAWTAVQWLLNAAMTANPIGIVIAIIVALVAAIVIAYQKSETFRSIVQAVFGAIAAAAIWLWENALKPLWDGIVVGFKFVQAAASLWWQAVQAYFQLLAAAATTLWNWIKAAWNGIVAAFMFVVAGAASFVNSVIGFFVNLKNQAAAQISAMISFVSSIPGRIMSAIGNLGSLLYNAGRNIIQGLINGVTSMISSLTSKLSFVTNLIPDWKGPEDKDRRLLVPAGQAIMQGLGAGIDSERAALQKQLAGVTNQIALTPASPRISGNVQGGDGADLAGGGGVRVWPSQSGAGDLGTLTIVSDGSRYSDLLVQELQHAVRVRGGNVQKVIGKTQGGVQ